MAGYKVAYSEKFGPVTSLIGAGVGGTYIVRSYRPSPTDPTETVNEHVLGPHFLLKFEFGPTFLAFDTVLGLTHQIQQHIFLNFQDVSHVTLGLSF